MGMTATWVFEPADGVVLPPGWEPVAGLRPGWSGAMVAAPADAPGQPALVTYVVDSGFCLLDAAGHWRWVINDEPFVAEADPRTLAEYGLPPELTGDDDVDDAARAERRRRVVPLMVAWAEGAGLPAPDPERLDDVLDRQYVPAETGFFALLDVLGICPAQERPVAEVAEVLAPLPEPEQETVDLWAFDRSGPRFAFQVDTYADLFTRLDAVAGCAGSDLWWLQLTADPDELDHGHVDRAAWVTRAVMPRRPNGNIGLTEKVAAT